MPLPISLIIRTHLFCCYVRFPFHVSLGNHTKRIATYSEKCVSENRQALIRVDGPYGNLSFNYRRYGSLVLVGGGIGITPIISIIKDIYEQGDAKLSKKPSHCMKNVHLLWIMPFEADAALFLDQLLMYRELSTHEPSLPLLEVSIHITREESMHKIESGPVFHSKPDFPLMMNECTTKAVEANSSSILIFACGPGR
jgi:predicted ferric reductase